MRISDWSSDVCSSDLNLNRRIGRGRRYHEEWVLLSFQGQERSRTPVARTLSGGERDSAGPARGPSKGTSLRSPACVPDISETLLRNVPRSDLPAPGLPCFQPVLSGPALLLDRVSPLSLGSSRFALAFL